MVDVYHGEGPLASCVSAALRNSGSTCFVEHGRARSVRLSISSHCVRRDVHFPNCGTFKDVLGHQQKFDDFFMRT